ncbi:MAG: PqiA/YebS family transporter subunit [Zetaproteobacteria bacterium]|nr:MAG: PqiA/YebS family transporter subunit [Zetaproteobacteria bacterium]
MPLIACYECDLLHRAIPLDQGGRAYCRRCGARLYQQVPGALQRTVAFYLAALICFFFANFYPFLSLKIGARMETVHLIDAARALSDAGMTLLGLLVLLTSLLIPLIMMVGHLYLLLPRLLWRVRPPACGWVFRNLRRLAPWSMVSIFMLGTLISVVKLLDLAEVIPGIGAGAFVVMMVLVAAAEASFDPHLIWPRDASPPAPRPYASALANGLVSCHYCALLVEASRLDAHGRGTCPRCGGGLHLRKPDTIHRTWALLAAAALLLLPANLYPVMTVIRLGQGEPSTILGGVMHLAAAGMWGLALIVLFASVVVPGLKLIAFSWILRTIHKRSPRRPVDRTRLYRLAEAVGAWSMVDVFVVALLTALVQMGRLATIEPNLGALFFAAVVVLTMLAAESFDPRLIWDNLPDP